MAEFRAALMRRRATRPRFRLPIPEDEAAAKLREAYAVEVVSRGGRYIDDEDTRSHIATAAKWLTGPYKPGLMLYGTVGNGKSTLARACELLVAVQCHSYNVDEAKRFSRTSAFDLADIAKNDTALFERLKKAELLSIDDVGVEPATIKVYGTVVSPFTDIMYYRYDRQLLTLVSSNLSLQDICDKYGERIGDRFHEMFDRIAFNNQSYRRR